MSLLLRQKGADDSDVSVQVEIILSQYESTMMKTKLCAFISLRFVTF